MRNVPTLSSQVGQQRGDIEKERKKRIARMLAIEEEEGEDERRAVDRCEKWGSMSDMIRDPVIKFSRRNKKKDRKKTKVQ